MKSRLHKSSRVIFVLGFVARTAVADDLDPARAFLASATDAYNQSSNVCSEGCEPELGGPVNVLGASLGPLRAAIEGGSSDAIANAIRNTSNSIQLVCSALRIDCASSPAGPIPTLPDQSMSGPASSPLCPECVAYTSCVGSAFANHRWCLNAVNEYAGCRKQTPFCDRRDGPFTPSEWNRCWTQSSFRQYLRMPGERDCRCPNPPGLGQRQGGCPEFFSQSGDVGIPGVCRVGDGRGCGRCCHLRCEPSDSRQSCRGITREECDVCEWFVRTDAASASMRANLCELTFVSAMTTCSSLLPACMQCPIDSCSGCPCGCNPSSGVCFPCDHER